MDAFFKKNGQEGTWLAQAAEHVTLMLGKYATLDLGFVNSSPVL